MPVELEKRLDLATVHDALDIVRIARGEDPHALVKYAYLKLLEYYTPAELAGILRMQRTYIYKVLKQYGIAIQEIRKSGVINGDAQLKLDFD